MKTETGARAHKACVAALLLLLITSLLSLPAMAALGGDLNSVQDDATQMKAAVKIQQKQAYAIHQITTQNKATTVREFVSPDGRVFGVAWQGLFMPNLSQLLGAYLQQYSAAAAEEHAKAPGRHPLMIHQPGLVVESSGRVRAYYGRAYVPDLLPQGVDPQEVR